MTTSTVTPGANVNIGDSLMVGIAYTNMVGNSINGGNITSVADSAGNVYNFQGGAASTSGFPGVETTLWTSTVTAGGGTAPTITVTGTLSGAFAMVVADFTGISTVQIFGGPLEPLLDVNGVQGQSGAFFTSWTFPATPTLSSDMVVEVFGLGDASHGSSNSDPFLHPGPTFTLLAYSGSSSASEVAMAVTDGGSAGSPLTQAWTWGGGLNSYVGVVGAFVNANPPGPAILSYSPSSW